MIIDLVYLWVDSNDPVWLARKNIFLGILNTDDDLNCKGRFVSNDELKFSLRSVEKYVPWINKIFIVTDQQIPSWLDISNPKIQIIDHKDILPTEALPCYNAFVIEYFLYRIPNLSENFLYANDDMFFNRKLLPSFFFEKDGYPIVRLRRQPLFQLLCVWKGLTKKPVSGYYKCVKLSAQLVKEKCGKYYCGLPHHNIDAYRKSDYEDAVEVFKDEITTSTPHHFRTDHDLTRSVLSYYALAIGHAHLKYTHLCNSLALPIWKKDYAYYFQKYTPALFCMNDGENVVDEDRARTTRFLEELFPNKSSFEQ